MIIHRHCRDCDAILAPGQEYVCVSCSSAIAEVLAQPADAGATRVSRASAEARSELQLQALEPESDCFLHPLLPLVPEAERPEVGSVRLAGDYLRKGVVVS